MKSFSLMAARAVVGRGGSARHHQPERSSSSSRRRRSRNSRSLILFLCYRRREEKEQEEEQGPAARPRRADRRRPRRLGRQPRRVVHALARPGGCQVARFGRWRGRSGSGTRIDGRRSSKKRGGGSEVEKDEGHVCQCGRRWVGQSLGRRPVEFRGQSEKKTRSPWQRFHEC